MAVLRVSDVRLAGVAAAVPACESPVEEASVVFGASEVRKIIGSTGVRSRRIAPAETCASDLCLAAAEELLASLSWAPQSIGALVFVSQTPDYVLPATSCVLHARLELPRSCAAWDVNLGCSGYVYGLWQAAQAAASGGRVLLLVGDTISRLVSPADRATALLFGDAGSATALEPAAGASPMTFVLGADGKGATRLIAPAGGFRTPRSDATRVRVRREGESFRSDEDLYLDGAEVFAFSLREAPPMIAELLSASGAGVDDVDYFVLHQANRFMLEQLARKLKAPKEKLPLILDEFGNTSGASIPLALVRSLAAPLRQSSRRLLLAGFGVGWSWGAAMLECGPIAAPELITLAATPASARPLTQGEACGAS